MICRTNLPIGYSSATLLSRKDGADPFKNMDRVPADPSAAKAKACKDEGI